MRCRACGTQTLRKYGEKNGVALYLCGCRSLNADVTQGDLPEYAQSYVQASFDAPPSVRWALARMVARLEGFRQTGRWADLGFGEGGLLVEAERQGWVCSGTEISVPSLEFGRSRGWDVSAVSGSWPDESFDVVSIVEVLEHVVDPEGLLREAARLLRPGGCLVGTTPNVQSLNFRVLGLRWSVVAPPEHVTLFSAPALARLIESIPLTVTSARTTGLNPTELLASRRGAISAAERNEGGLRLAQATSSATGRSFKQVANWGLNWLQAGDSLKFEAHKHRSV